MRLSDYGKLIRLLDEFEIPYTVYNDPDFIDDESIEAGAIFNISIRDAVNLNFDMDYNFISSSTDSLFTVIFRKTSCIDCGVETKSGSGSARCPSCWDDKCGAHGEEE